MMYTQTIKFKLVVFAAFAVLLTFHANIQAQSVPAVEIRFANPQFDSDSQTYSLDVEMRSDTPGEQLFGMNVRFFYDASMLTFSHLEDFKPGYGILGKPSRAKKGNSQSGYDMFGFYDAASYVNTGVQLLAGETSAEMLSNKWIKYFTAYFTVSDAEVGSDAFAPSLIWDLRSSANGGKYLSGSDGVVVTVVEHDPQTREESAPAIVEAKPFNWVRTSKTEMPFGHPVSVSKIPLSRRPSLPNGLSGMDRIKPELQQNQPNPFSESTKIEFYLPETAVARLNIFDVTGRLVWSSEDRYDAGSNAVVIYRDELTASAEVLFYRLESEAYISPTKRMMLLNR